VQTKLVGPELFVTERLEAEDTLALFDEGG
jgi:hypothetical protein